MKNIIEIFLEQLEVKYTHTYVTKLYNEHPHKYNMYGLFDILQSYNINAVGINVEDKDYAKLSFPCILHINNGFVVASKLSNKNIDYYWNGRFFSLSLEKFNSMWTGNAIVIDGDSEATEPNYIAHLHKERVGILKKALFAITFFVLLFLGISKNYHYYDLCTFLFVTLDILGILPCVLLMEKQIRSESRFGDKVCSLFHQKDCNSILSSEKATIFGVSWSEIGLSFFVANIITLTFVPFSVNELSVIAMLAVSYTIWSVYYQWRVIKQWCVLCLFVQVVIILMACSGLFVVLNNGLIFNCLYAMSFGSLWFVLVVVLNLFITYKETIKNYTESIQRYKALKSNPKVFQVLLTSGKKTETTFKDSTITFGNKNAQMRITVLTNPHCNPCAKTHIKIDNLIEKNKDKICIQYIFSSFNEELKESNRFLIAVWQELGEQQALEIFSQWYREGKYHAREFMDRWNGIDIHSISVENEIRRHEEWRKRTGYNATPTILVNEHELPEEYDIEDISMILD